MPQGFHICPQLIRNHRKFAWGGGTGSKVMRRRNTNVGRHAGALGHL
jgi:hypothetical protein